MGIDGAASTVKLEVKFYDFCKTNKCESIQPEYVRRSRTKGVVSKMIRYRRSPDCKRCQLKFKCDTLYRSSWN